MKITNRLFGLLSVFLLVGAFLPSAASAMTPSLSLSNSGDGDSVQASIYGDANSNVILYYTKTNLGPQMVFLGKTNSSGSFTSNLSSATYSVQANSAVKVLVNNQSSNEINWPSASASSQLSFSKTGIVLPLNQSTVLTVANSGSAPLYLSNNSNPPVANVSISGNQVTIYGIQYGSSVVTVCAQAIALSCASTYVTVQNTGAQPLYFSQSNVTVSQSSPVAVNMYGGNGAYILNNNSNPSLVTASVSGSVLNISTVGTSGFAALTVCSSDMSACSIVNVNVGLSSSVGLTFSQTNPSLSANQTLSIGISGPSNSTYSIISNSNSAVVSASLSGSNLNVSALSGGLSNIVVCSSAGNCGSISVTVTSISTGGPINLSQNNLWISVGQVYSITVSGGALPYSVFSNSAPNVASAVLSGNAISLSGLAPGSASISICSAGGGCTNLSVLVNGSSNSSLTPTTFSTSSLSLYVGNSANVTVYGNGLYFLSGNTAPTVASVSLNGNNLSVSAISVGSASISVCQNAGQCGIVVVNVLSPYVPVSTPVVVSTPVSTTATTVISPVSTTVKSNYKFPRQLAVGASGNDVTELQKRLTSEGVYSGPVTGYFGNLTKEAVRNYQKLNNIRNTGNVGPLTIAALNK